MVSYNEYLLAIETIKIYQSQINDQINSVLGSDKLPSNTPLYRLNISCRLRNCLHDYINTELDKKGDDKTLKDLQQVNIDKFKKYKGVGNKTVQELCEFLGKEIP